MSLKLVRRHGSPFWYIRGTVRGIAVDESTKLAEREDAEVCRAQRELQIRKEAVFGRSATATFLEAAVSYMETGGEARFLKPILDVIGSKPLAAIDQSAIDALARRLFPRAKPGTVNRQLYTPISAVLRHAQARGLCEHRVIARPTQPKGRVRWIKPEEADRLIAACSNHMRPLVTFLLYTGARLSEALYLQWSEIDLARAHVSFMDTKNGDDRGVPLHPRVVADLANIEHRSGAVFRRPDGKPYKPKEDGGGQIKTGFGGACRRAGIKDFTPHDCRHTWATWHYSINRDLGGLMKLGGWKSERMVLRYAHVNAGELARSIEALPWGNSGDYANATQKPQIKTKE